MRNFIFCSIILIFQTEFIVGSIIRLEEPIEYLSFLDKIAVKNKVSLSFLEKKTSIDVIYY